MEVKFNRHVDPLGQGPVGTGTGRVTPAPADSVSFEGTRKLTTALENTPEVRPEAVERARQLIGQVSYPPPETIRRIAELLAMTIDRETH